jgi:hypothetical protein
MFCLVLGTTSAAEAANNESPDVVERSQDSLRVAIPSLIDRLGTLLIL